jgi:hypothetical protein
MKPATKAMLGFVPLLVVGGIIANHWLQRPIEIASVQTLILIIRWKCQKQLRPFRCSSLLRRP